MTTEESIKMLAILKSAYPNSFKNITEETATGIINTWALHFKDISAFIVWMALNKHISTIKYPPTISEIKDKIKNLYYESLETMILYRNGLMELDEKKVRMFKSIMDELEPYINDKKIEPTVNELLDGFDNQIQLNNENTLKGKKAYLE